MTHKNGHFDIESHGNGKTTSSCSIPRIVNGFIITLLLAGFITTLVLLLTRDDKETIRTVVVVKDEVQNSQNRTLYRFASVASNTNLCSKVGTDIMAKQGGNAVDAAVATLLCIGLVRFHSSGLGGDSFWTIYNRENSTVYTIIARSAAPLASNETMFVNNTAALQEGGLSVAVPGEVMAFWEAHQKLGRLNWKDLFDPVIKMAKEGFPLEATTDSAIKSKAADGTLDRFPALKQLVTNPATNAYYKTGEIVRNLRLAATFEKIARGGAAEFYNGSLAQDMAKEIQDAGGIITKEDFGAYFADVAEPLSLPLHDNMTAYSPSLPSSGLINLYILNILKGYNMTPNDMSTQDKHILTYHRHLEAFKHAYASRSRLGSPYGETDDFKEEMKQIIANLTNPMQGEIIRGLISDSQTFPWQNYNPSFEIEDDHGTSHMSILGPNGDAVAVTSTINLYFGSKVVGASTGVIFNDLMDDFSTPGVVNNFGVAPSPSNFIKPGKRPMSSMSPTIVIDKDLWPVLIVGAAGGTKITTTTSLLTSLSLWLGEDIKSAIAGPRIHHQLLPDEAQITDKAPQWLIEGLRKKGHVVKVVGSLSTPSGIQQLRPGKILADAQGSVVDGF